MSLAPIVYLARHATPDWSRKDIPYHLPPGPPLCDRGLLEADQLRNFFNKTGIQLVYSSPLERCFRTAHIAIQDLTLDVEVIGALREVQPSETSRDILLRVWPVFLTAFENSRKTGPAALVTHGGVVAVLLEHLGMDAATLKKISVFDYHNPVPPAGAWKVTQASETTWNYELVFQPIVEITDNLIK